MTPPRIRCGNNFFVTLLSTLRFRNRSGPIYIKSWRPGVQRPPAPRRSKLTPRSPQHKKQQCFLFALYFFMVMYLFLTVLFYHRSGNEFHANDADGPGCNDRQQRVVKHLRSSSPAITKPNKPLYLLLLFWFIVFPWFRCFLVSVKISQTNFVQTMLMAKGEKTNSNALPKHHVF